MVQPLQAPHAHELVDIQKHHISRMVRHARCYWYNFRPIFASNRFSERVQPWLHYIPISVDYHELYDVLMFFKGQPGGRGRHDTLAEMIATEGRVWAETFFRKEDAIAYMFRYGIQPRGQNIILRFILYTRMILEYTRVMSTDRDTMNYYVPRGLGDLIDND